MANCWQLSFYWAIDQDNLSIWLWIISEQENIAKNHLHFYLSKWEQDVMQDFFFIEGDIHSFLMIHNLIGNYLLER